MNEVIDLTWKELCQELTVRKAGRKGEWKIPTEVLIQLWLAKRAKIPMAIGRLRK